MTHAIVNKEETRKLREITEIVNVDTEGTAVINTPFTWNAGEDRFYFKSSSKVFEKISKRYGLGPQELELEFKRRVQLLFKLYQKQIFKFDEVQEIITRYCLGFRNN